MISRFLEELRTRVLVFDGATGTNLQLQNLSAADFGGPDFEGCNEYLVKTKPEAVERVHRGFLDAGADIIETDTFGATSVVLAEYGLEGQAYELNFLAAQIARRLADEYSTNIKPRFVAGSVGPTTKLPSLGHIGYVEMRDSYAEQIRGQLDGGSDLLCIETCQDPLQTKSALSAARKVFDERGDRVPVIVSVTIESMGTMLMGTEISAALAIFEAYDIVDVFGMNCATGPKEMEENLRAICDVWEKSIFLMPNAGLPENIGGQTCYKLTPEEMERWMLQFVESYGVNIIGGCCGTTPEHIARLAAAAIHVRPASRAPRPIASVSSLYAPAPLRVDIPPVLIGERCNANGSKQFRELLLAEDYDGIVAMGKEQAREGAHVLDICAAYVGRDEVRDMVEIVRRFNTQIPLPLMIDSTEVPVIEAALQHCAGRAIVNSINLEDGEEKAAKVLRLCREYGAAVVALTIDEQGMAKTSDRKVEIATRLRTLAVETYGLRDEDLIFDTLTFTLGSGDEEFRTSAMETMDAIRRIKRLFPQCHQSLGVSNVSFGLTPRARHVLNSVFLHHAIEAGLDMAIVHASKIMPLYRIDERGREIARELIFDERRWDQHAS
ncbi:MAG: homocysteine S-methyltransferase family protein [Ignavibacteriae bacterium]|nr:homocysteine S-methyltransferase family protein [Ignavibacteriota bacterium]